MSTDDAAEADTSGQARSERFRQQFFKTQLCQLYKRGRCNRHELCRYAHGEEELRQAPDLCKTALCPEGNNCKDENCRFAHHRSELRATNEFQNKDPCKYIIRSGKCALGKSCRYSHSLDLCVDGQQDQAEGSQASSAAYPTQGSQKRIEHVRRPSEPKTTLNFQGRRALYGAPPDPPLDVDGVPARSMSIPADSEAPQALRLPPAPPLPQDSLSPLIRVRQAHPMAQTDPSLLAACLLFQEASTAHDSSNYLDGYPAGPPKPPQVFFQDSHPKDTRFATVIPTEPLFHESADSSLGSFTYAQEPTPQLPGQSAAAPRTSFDRTVRTATNGEYYIPQCLSQSAALSKDSHADYHSCATELSSGWLPDSIGNFCGRAKTRGGLPEAHLKESFFNSRLETGMPSGPCAGEDAVTVRGTLGLQHSHHRVLADTPATPEPFQSSVGALPAAAAVRTPEGLGAMSFWL